MSFTEKLELNVRRAWKPYEMYGPSIAIYTVVLSLIFALLSVVRMKLAGPSATLAAFAVSLIDNLSAAVIAAVIAALLLFFLFPKARLKEELAVLDSWNIGPVLKAPLERTNTYYFRGRSGRWLRSTVLPALFDAAGRESVTRSVHLLLPNPEDVGLLKSYADYRNSLSSGKTDVWTLDRIRNEIVATLLQAGRLAARSTFFEAHVILQNEFSLLRADLNDENLVITREEKHLPGWMSTAGSKFYASYLEDLRMAERRGRKIIWSSYTFPTLFTETDVSSAVQASGLTLTLSPDDVRQIFEAMEKQKSPYA